MEIWSAVALLVLQQILSGFRFTLTFFFTSLELGEVKQLLYCIAISLRILSLSQDSFVRYVTDCLVEPVMEDC